MRLVRPIAIDVDSLASSNVPEDNPEWNPASTYDVDDVVRWLGSDNRTHDFQSLQAANTGHSVNDAAWWLDLGPSNPWRMFDQSNSSVTTNPESIATAIQVDGRADSVSLLNIVGAAVRIVMETVEAGVIYDETFNLVSNSGVNDWYEYFFEPIVRKGDLTVYDLPLNADPIISVYLFEPGETATIGSLVIGQSKYLGDVIHPSDIGINDYSRKDADEFGNFTIIQRNFAKLAGLKLAIDEDRVDAIAALLAAYRATAVVWVGVEQYASTWVYGWAKNWRIQFAGPNETYLTLDLEGLT